MERNIKRFLSLVLAFVMVFGMMPANVFAVEDYMCDTCGNSLYVTGWCPVCNTGCDHSAGYENGVCVTCNAVCTHVWDSNSCTVCHLTCYDCQSNHNIEGKCNTCGNAVGHTFEWYSDLVNPCGICGAPNPNVVTPEEPEPPQITAVAQINGQGYETLADAIVAVQNGETIELLADISDNVAITQKKNVAFTIEGNGHTYSGEMTLKGISGDNGQALTIQNVKFECNGNYSIYTDSGSNFRNLTVDTCSFSGASYYALSLRNVYDITIKNTTAVNSGYGFFYASKAVNGLEVDNVEVTGTGYGFNLQYPTNAINFKNMNLDVAGSGLIFACSAKGIITIEGSTIKAGTPVTVQNKGTQRCTLTFIGNNTIITENENWLSNGNEAYFDVIYNGDEDAEDDFTLVLPVTNVAEVNGTGYPTLGEAIAAATSGQTITLLADVTEDVTVNKSVTIEGAGKTYTGTITVSGNADSVFQNVNFVKGNIKQTGNNTTASMKVQNCSFANGGYAIEAGRINDLTVVDCTVTGQSLLHVKLHINDVLVKNVTVDSGNYVARYLYGTKARFENVTATNMTGYGIQTQNNGPKTITLANCSFATPNYNSLHVSEVAAAVDTFIFEGTNTMTVLKDTEYDVYELTEGATLSAPEGYDVVTNVEGFDVIYENGTYKLGVKKNYVAQIGEQGYETLTAAIAAAASGQTITLLADVTEDVTVNKSVTIEGAEFNYTGTMNITKGISLTVQNLNFVSGKILKGKNTGSNANLTLKKCNFDGQGLNAYAVELRDSKNIVIEDCTAKSYGYGFLQLPKSNVSLSVKNVEISDVNYGFKIDYSNGVTMENVTVTNADYYGIYDSNYAAKTYNIKNCSFDAASAPIKIWDRNTGKTTTFLFEGTNSFGATAASLSGLGAMKLAEPNATLAGVEGMDVTTDLEGYEVAYENGIYRLAKHIAQNTNTGAVYTDLSDGLKEAVSGQTVILLAETAEELVLVPARVTFDLNGHVVKADNVLSFGIVRDSAEDVGGIKIDKDTTKAFTKLQPENGGYLPIYDTKDERGEMYKFFEYKLVNAGAKKSGSAVKFGFQITFTNTDAYGVLAETGYSGITLTAMVSWTDMSVPGIEYQFDYAEIQEYAASKAVAPSKNYVVFLSISGLENLAQGDFVSAAPVLTTVTEVACTNEAYEYNIE